MQVPILLNHNVTKVIGKCFFWKNVMILKFPLKSAVTIEMFEKILSGGYTVIKSVKVKEELYLLKVMVHELSL